MSSPLHSPTNYTVLYSPEALYFSSISSFCNSSIATRTHMQHSSIADGNMYMNVDGAWSPSHFIDTARRAQIILTIIQNRNIIEAESSGGVSGCK